MSLAHSRAGQIVSLVLAALTAVAVLTLAVPRLLAALRFLPVEIAIDRYYATREVPTDRLDVLIRFTKESIALHNDYRYHNGMSLLQLLRAVDFNTPALERRDAYVVAEQESMLSVAAAPAQPMAWLRIATVRMILHEEEPTILAAWKMSIFTGRTDSSLLGSRIELGFSLFEFLDTEAVAMLRDQLLLGWRMQPGTVIRILFQRDRDLIVTGSLIAHSDPAALAEMEAWIAKLH